MANLANQTNSLAWNVEQWLIDILRATEAFPEGFAIEHFDAQDRADKDRIVIQATVGERDLAGCEPWNVAATIERFSVTTPEDTGKLYDAAVDDALASPTEVDSLAAFAFLDLQPAEDEQKSASGNTRSRSRTFNFLALEAEIATP